MLLMVMMATTTDDNDYACDGHAGHDVDTDACDDCDGGGSDDDDGGVDHDEDDGKDDDEDHDSDENVTSSETFEDVDLVVDLSGVEEVENLHPHKNVEHVGEVSAWSHFLIF